MHWRVSSSASLADTGEVAKTNAAAVSESVIAFIVCSSFAAGELGAVGSRAGCAISALLDGIGLSIAEAGEVDVGTVSTIIAARHQSGSSASPTIGIAGSGQQNGKQCGQSEHRGFLSS